MRLQCITALPSQASCYRPTVFWTVTPNRSPASLLFTPFFLVVAKQ